MRICRPQVCSRHPILLPLAPLHQAICLFLQLQPGIMAILARILVLWQRFPSDRTRSE